MSPPNFFPIVCNQPAKALPRQENPFISTPVEIVQYIATFLPYDPEIAAKLAVCNQDLESILDTIAEPAMTAYVAICTLNRNLILRTLRKRGGEAFTVALTMNMDGVYALDLIVKKLRFDLGSILHPYITHGDPSTLAAFKEAIAFRHQGFIDLLMPLLGDNYSVEAIEDCCITANPADITRLIQQLPLALREQVCTSRLELSVVTFKADLLRVLIAGGADVKKIMTEELWESEWKTCLHWLGTNSLWTSGCLRPAMEMIRMMCRAGADINATDAQQRTPIHELALAGSRRVGFMSEFDVDLTKERLERVYESVLNYIIRAGADINAQDEDGMTPLHMAVRQGEIIMIKVLLQSGVNTLITNDKGVRASQMHSDLWPIGPYAFQVLSHELMQEVRFGRKWAAVL